MIASSPMEKTLNKWYNESINRNNDKSAKMIIFSNDYLANLPGSKKQAKGGPANFAKRFKSFLMQTEDDCLWIGLIINFKKSIKQPRIKKIGETGESLRYYRLNIPERLIKKISRAPKKINAAKEFKSAIDLLAGLMKKTKTDVIFLNGYALSNWLILKAAETAAIPVAIQHAGIWTKELEMYHDFYSPAGRKMMEDMEKEITKIAAAEIFLNDWSRKYFNTKVGKTAGDKTHIIPLPVDFKNYSCAKRNKNTGKIFDIGIIARWDRIKNHEAVAELAEQARKLDLPWQFHSVTIIPDTSKKKRLKDSYRRNIKLVPPLNQIGIKKFCQRMDLLILPSHFDVSPHVVLEATGCDTPIAISPNVGFVDDFKKYGAKDWIIDFNNTAIAIRKIMAIANKPMPEKIKKILIAKHDSTKIFTSYMKLFKKIIKK